MPPVIQNKTIKRSLKAIKDRFPKTRFFWAMSAFITGRSAYHQLGWFKSSWRLNAINKQGGPIPWITYAAIDFLEKKCKKELHLKVWEYGSGNSTLWWAKRAASITAVEHHQGWYEHIRKELSPYKKANIIYCALGDDYPEAILKGNTKYDVIVIDGRMRVECAKAALQKLSKNGIIVWDNTERLKYQSGIAGLEKGGFKRIDFIGPVPIGNYLGQTTVFYRSNNVLGI